MTTLEKLKMTQQEDNLVIGEILLFMGGVVFLVFYIFLFNARCNDIGLSTSEKIGAFFVSLIPILSLFVFLHLIFKKGEEYQ